VCVGLLAQIADGTEQAAKPLRYLEAAGCQASDRSLGGSRSEAIVLEKGLFFNNVR
jgi:hypothetical protein